MANVMVLRCAQVTVHRIWELVKETSGTILLPAHSLFTGEDTAFFLSGRSGSNTSSRQTKPKPAGTLVLNIQNFRTVRKFFFLISHPFYSVLRQPHKYLKTF